MKKGQISLPFPAHNGDPPAASTPHRVSPRRLRGDASANDSCRLSPAAGSLKRKSFAFFPITAIFYPLYYSGKPPAVKEKMTVPPAYRYTRSRSGCSPDQPHSGISRIIRRSSSERENENTSRFSRIRAGSADLGRGIIPSSSRNRRHNRARDTPCFFERAISCSF